MDEREVRRLLATAMAYDNRKPGQAAILAWTEAARRARWTFATAEDAIHQHYAARTDFLMPGHITEIIRAARRQPAPIAEQFGRELPARVQAAIDAAAPSLRADSDERPSRIPWRRRRMRLTAEERAMARAELDRVRPATPPTTGATP